MPGFDGTGPQGKGPRTGRGLGDCDEKEETKKQEENEEDLEETKE